MAYIQLDNGDYVNLDHVVEVRRIKPDDKFPWARWIAYKTDDVSIELGRHGDDQMSLIMGMTMPANSAEATYIYRLWRGEKNTIDDVFVEKQLVIAWFRDPDGLQWQPVTTHGLVVLGYEHPNSMDVLQLPDGGFDIPEDQCFDDLEHAKKELIERYHRYSEIAAKRKAAAAVNSPEVVQS